jgi:hypothetical protein
MSGSGSHAGRSSSWIAVSVILIGFSVAGVALPLGPNWPLFWIGTGIAVLGGIVALAVDIMADVVMDEKHG